MEKVNFGYGDKVKTDSFNRRMKDPRAIYKHFSLPANTWFTVWCVNDDGTIDVQNDDGEIIKKCQTEYFAEHRPLKI